MATAPINQYVNDIDRELKVGKWTEHTHRPALKALIQALAKSVTATNEPRRVECGAPDFTVSKAPGPLTVGFIECKDIGEPLEKVERSEQLARYLRSLPNLVLTDYLEFRWYVDGEPRQQAGLGALVEGKKLKVAAEGPSRVTELLQNFLSHPVRSITSPKELAESMALLTHMIRDIVVVAFEKKKASDVLKDLREAFARTLIPDLGDEDKTGEFGDMYAQTLAYGLFAARVNHEGADQFTRVSAAAEIPKTNPFLRKVFSIITGPDLADEPYAGFVDDLVQVLSHADIEAILEHFGKRGRRQDPVVHFYETFLATYDPEVRERRGVYYTPEEVVSYIVRSVDYLLRSDYGLSEGLADTTEITYEYQEDGKKPKKIKETAPRVLVLDPACGTGTFLYSVVDLIREEFMGRGDAGMWSDYVGEHLLPRLFGFELLMAPYAVAHLKLGMQLAGHDLPPKERKVWGRSFSKDERLGVYLTNTLEEAERILETKLFFLRVLTEEAQAAARVKQRLPILVVMGNPPYSGHSANRSWVLKKVGKKKAVKVPTFIGRLNQDYYRVDGKPLEEANPKWLQDDYVKFIRWGQWRIEQTGAGILAYITNHSYLDNPTFRGMRRALMRSFSEIYVLDLHGNAKRKERAPDGSEDHNVFDIQQGVAIGIFVRDGAGEGEAKVHHADLWGTRDAKAKFLLNSDVSTSTWKRIHPRPPYYFFVPMDLSLFAEYEKGRKITDVFPLYSLGVLTKRDKLSVAFDRSELVERLERFANPDLSPKETADEFGLLLKDKDRWNLAKSKDALASIDEGKVKTLLYRPFDLRVYYDDDAVVARRNTKVLGHFRRDNIGLIVGRQGGATGSEEWDVVWCTRRAADQNLFRRGGATVFPLYLYPDGQKQTALIKSSDWPRGKRGRIPNLNPEYVKDLATQLKLQFVSDGAGDLKKTVGPEDIAYYTYAILHCPTYRGRYGEYLDRDFPYIPLTGDRDVFRRLRALGRQLSSLHTLALPTSLKLTTRYPVPGDHRVEEGYPKYLPPGSPVRGSDNVVKNGRVHINRDQYFEGVPPEVWGFQVGGFQVCEKWLKDRQGRKLSFDERTDYEKTILVIRETVRLMNAIDEAVKQWPLK